MCSAFFLNHLGSVPKRRNGSAPPASVGVKVRTPAPHQSPRLLNETQGYLLSHSPHPADGVRSRSVRLLQTTALRDSRHCSLCVGQILIPSLDQIHHRNHLPVNQEALHPIPRARLGDHRNWIIHQQGHTCDYIVIALLYLFFYGLPLTGDMYSIQPHNLTTTLGWILH